MKKSVILKRLALLIFLAFYAVIMFAFKLGVAFIPNFEPVSVMIIALTAVFGPWAFVSVYVYVFCEIFYFGINIWNVMYLYVWALLALIVWFVRTPLFKLDGRLKRKGLIMTGFYSVLAAIFGLCFGTLCCVPYIFAFGVEYAIAWVVSGFAFDVLHCVGNAVMTAVMFYPLYVLLLKARMMFAR